MLPLAHIYGIPVEEVLVPLGGVSVAVLTASVAHRVHLVRDSLRRRDRDRVAPDERPGTGP